MIEYVHLIAEDGEPVCGGVPDFTQGLPPDDAHAAHVRGEQVKVQCRHCFRLAQRMQQLVGVPMRHTVTPKGSMLR